MEAPEEADLAAADRAEADLAAALAEAADTAAEDFRPDPLARIFTADGITVRTVTATAITEAAALAVLPRSFSCPFSFCVFR